MKTLIRSNIGAALWHLLNKDFGLLIYSNEPCFNTGAAILLMADQLSSIP